MSASDGIVDAESLTVQQVIAASTNVCHSLEEPVDMPKSLYAAPTTYDGIAYEHDHRLYNPLSVNAIDGLIVDCKSFIIRATQSDYMALGRTCTSKSHSNGQLMDFNTGVRNVPYPGTDQIQILDLDRWKTDFPALAEVPFAESRLEFKEEYEYEPDEEEEYDGEDDYVYETRSFFRKLPTASEHAAKKEPELAGHFKKIGTEKIKPLLDSRVDTVIEICNGSKQAVAAIVQGFYGKASKAKEAAKAAFEKMIEVGDQDEAGTDPAEFKMRAAARVDYEKKRAPKLAKFCKYGYGLQIYSKDNDKYTGEAEEEEEFDPAMMESQERSSIWHENAFPYGRQLHNMRLVATDAAKASLDGAIVTVWEQFTKDLAGALAASDDAIVACISEEIKLQKGDEQTNADTLAQLELDAADDSDSDGGFF